MTYRLLVLTAISILASGNARAEVVHGNPGMALSVEQCTQPCEQAVQFDADGEAADAEESQDWDESMAVRLEPVTPEERAEQQRQEPPREEPRPAQQAPQQAQQQATPPAAQRPAPRPETECISNKNEYRQNDRIRGAMHGSNPFTTWSGPWGATIEVKSSGQTVLNHPTQGSIPLTTALCVDRRERPFIKVNGTRVDFRGEGFNNIRVTDPTSGSQYDFTKSAN